MNPFGCISLVTAPGDNCLGEFGTLGFWLQASETQYEKIFNTRVRSPKQKVDDSPYEI